MDRDKYSTRGLEALQNCCGFVMAHIDGGYYLNLTAMPANTDRIDNKLLNSHGYAKIATEALNEVGENFREQLQALTDDDLKRHSMMKQCLARTDKFEVLELDLPFVLTLLQRAIDHTNRTDEVLKLVPSITRFGQKQDFPLYLGFLKRDKVAGMTVHFACNIRAKNKNTHLMWSRYGLQAVSAHREIG